MERYIFHSFEDVEGTLVGPFANDRERDLEARRIRQEVDEYGLLVALDLNINGWQHNVWHWSSDWLDCNEDLEQCLEEFSSEYDEDGNYAIESVEGGEV